MYIINKNLHKQGKIILFILLSMGVYVFSTKVAQAVKIKTESNSDATISFMGDARPRTTGEVSLVEDFDAVDDITVLGSGRSLDAMVLLGDMDYVSHSSGNNTQEAYDASDISDTPLFFTVGNHELETAFDIPDLHNLYSQYSYHPQAGPSGTQETTYSFDVGDVHVAVINEYWDGNNDSNCEWYATAAGDDDDSCNKYSAGDGGYIPDTLFTWLKRDLRDTDKPYKFVVGHEPAYPNVRHVGDSLDADENNRDALWNLLRTENVVAYISGHDHYSHLTEYDGVFQADVGTSGDMVGGDTDAFATIIYANVDDAGELDLRMAREGDTWETPSITTSTRADLQEQVLVNTWESAGSESTYYVDYSSQDVSNPNWSSNRDSEWWNVDFDDSAASWSDGELSVGYDETDPDAWGWLNTSIDSKHGVYGVFQRVDFNVHDKALFNTMTLNVDYDDAIVVWLNGVEMYRSDNAPGVGENDTWDKGATSLHNAAGDVSLTPVFTSVDVSDYVGYLHDGENVLAIGNWNYQLSSSDIAAAVELTFTQSSDESKPTGSVNINDNDVYTNSNKTTLTLSSFDNQGVTQMRFSNDKNSWSYWKTYADSASWNITNTQFGGIDQEGEKKVYAQFRDAAGNTSKIYSDSIEYWLPWSIITGAGSGGGPHVRAFYSDGTARTQPDHLFAFEESYHGGVHVASGDIDGDDKNEIVVGAGREKEPLVKIFEEDGTLVSEFLVYESHITGGVFVACGDVDGNGRDEIITGVPEGYGPHVRVFDGRNGQATVTPGFFAYDPSFRNGIRVASGDLDGDGKAEIITGTGMGGGTHVRTFTGTGEMIFTPGFFVYEQADRTGINIGVGDIDNNGKSEIITGSGATRDPEVKVYSRYGEQLYVFTPYGSNYRLGVKVASGDVDGDGVCEVITGTEFGGGPHVRIFDPNGEFIDDFFAYDEAFRGGVEIVSGVL